MSLGSHQSTIGKSQVHLTPRWLLDTLGNFDLDPCAATVRPWDCANFNFTEADDGLSLPWFGRVFLNPPFDRYQVAKWIQRLADHGNGIALVHARTEAAWFEPIWKQANLILFLADRIKFCRPDGSEQPANSGAPPVLAAFGPICSGKLWLSGLPGAYVKGWTVSDGDRESDGRRQAETEGLGAKPDQRGAAEERHSPNLSSPIEETASDRLIHHYQTAGSFSPDTRSGDSCRGAFHSGGATAFGSSLHAPDLPDERREDHAQ